MGVIIMTKVVAFGSDLHVDTNFFEDLCSCCPSADCLFLLGDLCNFDDSDILYSLAELTDKPIYFVPGNHDYWGGSIKEVNEFLLLLNKEYPLFIPMLGDRIEYLENKPILGHTLWYPDTVDSWLLQDRIKDFTFIKGSNPSTFHELNQEARQYFSSSPKGAIWLIHHLPSELSTGSHKGDRLNCYYVDPGMEKIIMEREPFLVIHGHNHEAANYRIGDTLVISNPRGYKNQNPNWDWQFLLLG